tara:strand:- start:5493 stop:7349 length:1857 start_codon:yes stop_codon:yes gene_type:complete
MAENNFTVWQRLTKVFGPDSTLDQQPPVYNFDKKELLKTRDKEEYEREKLQAQQTLYLGQQWQKVENNLYTQAVYYEPTRLAAFYDYESMEFTPEISAALDIYAEESTTANEDGFILQVYSESNRIKSVLTDLFNNRLDIDTNLPMWTRNTTKYGDNFVYLKLDPEKGILGAQQLPNIEIERLERGMASSPGQHGMQQPTGDADEDALKFKWKVKDIEFNTWEIGHFRLLGDDRKLPYGTSMLEKARRIWKQLILSEDAMLIYRTSRAPERRVFKVFVGNMDDKDVEPYVQRVANKFKRDQVADPQTGNVDLRMNQMAVDQDYFIPVRDPNSPNPIDTLPGATNLSEIADIEYIQKKLLTALRVPKAFLGFEEVTGDGKNLALQDIRFARTINRIQRSMIQELNKIAIIHLYILGFEDELQNFTLGLTNPSSQADLLKVEQWQQKIQLYRDATSDPGNGILPVSSSWAKKHILGFSDEEIKLDLQQQRIERAVAGELEKTQEVITSTGIFDNLDKLYGDKNTDSAEGGDTEGGDDLGGGDDFGGGSDFGGGDLGGDLGEPAGEIGDTGDVTPENLVRNKDLDLVLEDSTLFGNDETIDLSKARQPLGEMEEKLNQLLK